MKAAIARAFEDTGIDPEKVIEDYVKLKHSQNAGKSEYSSSAAGGN